ncbi:uncharacterized protein PHACADRAFT_260451 [Phanerochaete carnosa HHB-10118-sp]|uniref:C2H2-type domain-containing protein n=1 Tax=Phanerochaete carnosa (strain HHB-10118-sp) TaxID=650164 RepID=K5WPF1_PHACS|nr:uncharacterized protein PHACADRAFT_260451 [Phanerochaete carnosa HHB-10118-sp]EKM52222.1 hypothetical protein PHACADRAFT_260451 [Phanerochaete carnosa HHB-10118-sp]
MAYCHRCERYFKNEAALEQHKADSSSHWMCYDCDRDFGSYDARRQHYKNSSLHHYCAMCNEDFEDDNGLEDHYDNYHFYCRECEEFFDSLEEEDDHKEKEHWFCKECRRMFNTKNGLIHHRRTHLSKNLRCPGNKCGRTFALPADLILHFESGTCRSGVTRRAVDEAVIRYDSGRVITDPSRLLLGPDGEYTKLPDPVRWATRQSWNGSAFECVLCHRTFCLLPRLNQHLQSPAHADTIYRCPALFDGCGSHFGTLSALVQHVEIANCGVRRFKNHVGDVMDDLSRNLRGLGI